MYQYICTGTKVLRSLVRGYKYSNQHRAEPSLFTAVNTSLFSTELVMAMNIAGKKEVDLLEEAILRDPAYVMKALMKGKGGENPIPDEKVAIDQTKPPIVVNCKGEEARKQGFRGTRDWCSRPGNLYIESSAKRYAGLQENSIWENPFSVREWGNNMSLALYAHHVR